MNSKNNKALAWLGASHFILDSYSGFLTPILPFIAAKINISMTIAALMISVSNLTSSISQPLFGFVADKIKKRFFIFWGIIFASTFLSLVGIATNPYMLAIFIILGSMGVSFYHPQGTSFVAFFSLDKDANKNMGFYIAMGTLGFSIAPLISSGITDIFGLEKLPFASVVGIITALAMFLFVPKLSLYELSSNDSSFLKAFKDIIKNKDMVILIMISVLKSLVVSSFTLTLPFLWKQNGFRPSQIGMILFVFLVFGAAGTYMSAFIENRFGIKKVFYLSMMSVFPLAIIFYNLHNTHFLYALIAFVLIGFVSFLSVPVNMVMAQKIMPQYNSMISGFIGGFSWGIVGLMLPLISLIAQKFGILNVLLFISIIPLVFSRFVKYLPEH